MRYQKILRDFLKFMDKLQDNESRKLLEIRLQYLFTRNKENFYDSLDKVLQIENTDDFSCWRLDSYEQRNIQNKGKNIIIFGAGVNGRLTCRSLKYISRNVNCFVDNNDCLWGKEWRGISICSLAKAKRDYKDSIIIVAVPVQYHAAIYHQLINEGVRESDILMPYEGYLYCDKKNQYFDVKEIYPENEEEFFVDAGCYNGQTALNYGKLCGKKLKRIYAFEPDHNNYTQCDIAFSLSGYEYELFECAVWSERTMLGFCSLEKAGYASHVSENEKILITADSIDNKLGGRKATYIKYDVEGSELQALKGSIKTIQKYRPKLAISVYHKPEDIIEIPVFLETLGLDYRYYLRHYQTRMQETVLYAV